jgi:hypothetical protein
MDRIVYKRENPEMIDIKNVNPISIRSLRARVVDEEYNDISPIGLSVMVILIDDN